MIFVSFSVVEPFGSLFYFALQNFAQYLHRCRILPAIVSFQGEKKNLLNRGKAAPLERPEKLPRIKGPIKFGVRYIEPELRVMSLEICRIETCGS
jgi:hypothetical protein